MASVCRVSILGTMPGGEVWSVTPTFFLLDEPASVTGAEAVAIATAVDALTIPTGMRAFWSSSVGVTGTRVEARTMAGILEAQGEHARGTTIFGTSANGHPFQTSTVTSLRTAFPGGQGRGRLYWPATGAPITPSTLRVSGLELQAFLDGVKTYLAGIQSAVAVSAGPCQLAVWSRTGTAAHAVTSLKQGDITDTQRRRRDALTEAYLEVAYP